MPPHTRSADEVAAALGTGPKGLSRVEAQQRLERDGPNQLAEAPPTSPIVLLLHQFTSPLIFILLAAAVVTLALRDYADAAVIGAVLLLNAIIGFTQEQRAEQSVRALMRLMAPKARVIRDRREWEIEGRELVAGDVVLLESGARVPADLRLFAVTGLRVDESLLTGESLPVSKTTDPLADPDRPLADRTNIAYMASVVTTGRARGYVVATGPRTEVGHIAEAMRGQVEVETPLQQRMRQFAHLVAVVVVVAALAAFGIGVALGQAPADMFLVAVALAVSAVPEGLPIVFTVTLAIGVRRMARRNAIVRRLPAVETLGSTTVIGSDKTGTLTENRMTVQEVWTADGTHDLRALDTAGSTVAVDDADDAFRLTLVCGVLTSEAKVYQDGDRIDTQGDPTEAALVVAALRSGIDPAAIRGQYASLHHLPFETERRYSASVRRKDGRHVLFVKGAPERVVEMCGTVLTARGEVPVDRDAALAAARRMAAHGLRVLGLAYRELSETPSPDILEDPGDLTLVGLQGMLDPPRAGVRDAIRSCRRAGIRVVMITGDHAETARAIGRDLDLASPDDDVLTGSELDALDDAGLRARTGRTPIYARVSPAHKLRVVQTLRGQGEVVAVTGDGVNDAPALKAADIGVAMGRSGTDVAREAADMVLADDNFVSISAAVEEGRVTFDNLRKATFFLVSTGAAEVMMILTALVAGWPLPLVAAQILWLNLVTNGLQDVALAFEPGEPDVLRHPPRPRSEGVMSTLLWERTIIAGVVMAAGTLFLFQWELARGEPLVRAQTVALTTMVVFQAFHVGNCRSERQSVFTRNPLSNPFLFLATAAALAIHVGALHAGPMQLLLRIEPLPGAAWGRIVVVAASILAAMEIHKLLRRRRD